MDFLNKLIALLTSLFSQPKAVETPLPKLNAGVDAEQLCEIYGCTAERAATYAQHLNAAMGRYSIDLSPLRMAHFLAQIGHESGRLAYAKEIWGPTPAQSRYERDFSAPWPRSAAEAKKPEFAKNRLAYNLGNHVEGDGERFMGRGLIQITGRSNYEQLTKTLGVDAVSSTSLLSQPYLATLSAGWYWDSRGLNAHAENDDLLTITKRINGGTNGLEDRKVLLARAKQVLGVTINGPAKR